MTDILLRRGLKLGHLRIVAALAQTGQIGTAAAAVGITQPAASRLLAEVERITGHPVHVRDGRGVRLTAQGSALATRAARILTEIADAGREISEIGDGTSGHVRIGSVTGPAMERILPALNTIRQSYPDLTVEVEVAPSDILGELLVSGRIDFALARLPEGRDATLYTLEPMEEEPVSLVTGRHHPLVQASDLTARLLLDYDWLLPGPGAILRETVLSRLTALGLPAPSGQIATSSFLLTLAMLQQSDAIAPLASAVARRFADGVDTPYAILPMDLGIRVTPYGLITRAGGRLTPAANRLRNLILSAP